MKAKKQLNDKKKKTGFAKHSVHTKDGNRLSKNIFDETKQAFIEAGFTADNVAQEYALIGFADMADFVEVDESGIVRALPFDQLTKNKSRIIKKIREKRVIRTVQGTKDKPDGEEILDSTFEFELHDKMKALSDVVNILGMKAPEKIEIHTNIAEELEAARQRVKGRK